MFRALHRRILRFLLRTVRAAGPWDRIAAPVPVHVYGLGSRQPFDWYLQGESTVEVVSLEDVLEWLLGCTYATDRDLFRHPDYWQHPCAFERMRQGDCEDFALWAWRKLVRLGYDAEFIVGYVLHPEGHSRGHAWVVFRQNGESFVFDPSIRTRLQMVAPLFRVAHEYVPEVSVDGNLARYVYTGYALWRSRAS